MECGGTCFLLYSIGPEDDYEPGDFVAYRCPDCNERWDMELDDDDDPESRRDGDPGRA